MITLSSLLHALSCHFSSDLQFSGNWECLAFHRLGARQGFATISRSCPSHHSRYCGRDMNTRQLSQGLMPTPEFERHHTYHTLRQFPELRRTMNEMEHIKLRTNEFSNPQSHSKGISRSRTLKSTHKLEELSKSVVEEMSVMTDFRRVLIENRQKMKQLTFTGSVTSLPSIATAEDLSLSGSISPVEAADQKLEKISISFDSQSYNSHLAGFAGSKLSKREFAIQLRRCLNINLRRVELDALFEKMDMDRSGLIDGVEFVRYFFALGKNARARTQHESVKLEARRSEKAKAQAKDKERRIKEWESSQISNYTEADAVSAMRKLQDAAFRWDHTNYIESAYVNGFEAYLTPYDFKQQIERSFQLRLSGAEIGALLEKFSTRPGEHSVDGYLFLKHFCALRERTRQEYTKAQARLARKKEAVMKMGQHTDILPRLLGR